MPFFTLAKNLHLCCLVAAVLFFVAFTSNHSAEHKVKKSAKKWTGNFMELPVSNIKVPFLTSLIYTVHVLTMICILAVDFKVFPRRFAKTETFGCSLMDFGVGGFVFVNGLVTSYARKDWKVPSSRKSSVSLRTRLLSSIPLFILGLARLAAVKSSGYQTHISEYGVHWNFFFTLAFVKVLTDVILVFVPVRHLVFGSLATAFLYQYLLTSSYDLTSLLLNDSRRDGLLLQNKEGILSSIGFFCIYLVSIAYGSFIFQRRKSVRDWIKVCYKMLAFSFFLLGVLLFSKSYIQDSSRRMANLSYIIWVVTHCSFHLSLFLLVDLLLVFLIFNRKLPASSMPNQWVSFVHAGEKDKEEHFLNSPCLMAAVNRNQLFIFLFSNLLTGAVNFTVDTIDADTATSLVVLVAYMFVVLTVVWILHIKKKTVKALF